MKRFLLVSLVLACLSGCATQAGYERALNTFIGVPSDGLRRSWGPPHTETSLPDGGTIYEYRHTRAIYVPGMIYTVPKTTFHSGTVYGSGRTYQYDGTSTTLVTTQTPGYTAGGWCTTRFKIDASGFVYSWQHEGNDCISE